jgi:hypothetical protein
VITPSRSNITASKRYFGGIGIVLKKGSKVLIIHGLNYCQSKNISDNFQSPKSQNPIPKSQGKKKIKILSYDSNGLGI